MTTDTPIILSLEASAGQASAALAQGDQVLAQANHDAPHGHAAWMVHLAEDVLSKAQKTAKDITLVIGGTGPGSFTGIRVALAAAKGYGLTQNTTPIGISSLAALAADVTDVADDASGKPILTLIDSRRKSWFMQLFDANLTPLTPIVDGGFSDDHHGLSVLFADHHDIMSKGVLVTGHASADFAHQLNILGFSAEQIGSTNPHAAGLINAYQTNPALAAIAEPLYLAPPILGQASKKGAES